MVVPCLDCRTATVAGHLGTTGVFVFGLLRGPSDAADIINWPPISARKDDPEARLKPVTMPLWTAVLGVWGIGPAASLIPGWECSSEFG